MLWVPRSLSFFACRFFSPGGNANSGGGWPMQALGPRALETLGTPLEGRLEKREEGEEEEEKGKRYVKGEGREERRGKEGSFATVHQQYT